MQELERKASTPGEGLSHSERDEWHRLDLASAGGERLGNGIWWEGLRVAFPPDYTAATRYLDSPARKAR